MDGVGYDNELLGNGFEEVQVTFMVDKEIRRSWHSSKVSKFSQSTNRDDDFIEVETPTMKNLKGESIIRYGMIDEGNLIYKGFHRV